MFTAALFKISNTWKQPKSQTTDEWMKKMSSHRHTHTHTHTHTQNGILLSHKKEWNSAIFNNADGPREYNA